MGNNESTSTVTVSKLVDLGFADECESWLLTNRYFPSKVGGKPAWLELNNLPKIEELICPKCNQPRTFLCQVYAPIESRDDCFHRTIFIFVCQNPSCYELNSASNMIAFRSQLPRCNDFYSFEPPDESVELPEILGPLKLCDICGCHGRFVCSQCKNTYYCSKEHQKIDWKLHRKMCKKQGTDKPSNNKSKNISSSSSSTSSSTSSSAPSASTSAPSTSSSTSTPSSTPSSILFPEYDIIIGTELLEDSGEDSEEEKSKENVENADYERIKQRIEREKNTYFDNLPEEELMKYTSENVEDKQFIKFKKRTKRYPAQIIRYQLNGQPLYISDNFMDFIQTTNIIPHCENCGNKRIFEFQIMPQLLNYLKNDNIDWGVLLIYTCSKSCDTKSQYQKEFILKHDITSSPNNNN